MEQYKSSGYVWIFALLANFCLPIFWLNEAVALNLNPITEGYADEILFGLLISLSLTLIPVWISGLTFKSRHYIGYILPTIVIIYSYYQLQTCSGWFCQIPGAIAIMLTSVFLIFYTCGHFLRKINPSYTKTLIYTEIATILTFVIGIIASGGIK